MKQMLGAGLSSFDEEYDGEVAWQGVMVCAHWRCGPTSLPCLRLMTKMTLFSGTYSYSCSEGVPPWCLYYMYNQRSDLILANPFMTFYNALNLINLSGVQSRVSSLWQDNKSHLCVAALFAVACENIVSKVLRITSLSFSLLLISCAFLTCYNSKVCKMLSL